MSRFPKLVTGRSHAATGTTLAIAAVLSLILLSRPGPAAARGSGSHAQPPLALGASASTTVSLRATRLGRILVASNGHTVYAFSRDGRDRDRCAMIRGCTEVWPIVTVDGKLRAGRGVSASRLGTIRVGRVRQVTYAGHPLYTYSGDSGPGDTGYVGVSQFGGSWPALSSTGRLVR